MLRLSYFGVVLQIRQHCHYFINLCSPTYLLNIASYIIHSPSRSIFLFSGVHPLGVFSVTMLVVDSFYLYENVFLSPSFLNNSLADDRLLDKLFSFSILRISFHCLPGFFVVVTDEKPAASLNILC